MAPCAAISSGNGDEVLSCVHLASKRGLPLVRLGAGQRRQMRSIAGDLNAMLLDRMSDILYTPTLKMHYTLYREGISADRVVCVGTPLADGLRMALTDVTPISDLLRSVGLPREQMRRAINGYVLFSVQADSSGLSGSELVRVAKVARDLGKETLTIWFASEATAKALSESSLDTLLQRSGVALVPYTGYGAQLGLIRGATCVISGPGRELVEEANCLDVPTIAIYPGGEVPSSSTGGASAEIACDAVACARALHKILERGRAEDESPSESEDGAVVKILEHLRGWLPASNAKGASRPSSVGVTTR
jgi:UDP-N-acetylglucosamine 2-epimerase (non-hydrolysing)